MVRDILDGHLKKSADPTFIVSCLMAVVDRHACAVSAAELKRANIYAADAILCDVLKVEGVKADQSETTAEKVKRIVVDPRLNV